jgi:hypothetical protein
VLSLIEQLAQFVDLECQNSHVPRHRGQFY